MQWNKKKKINVQGLVKGQIEESQNQGPKCNKLEIKDQWKKTLKLEKSNQGF